MPYSPRAVSASTTSNGTGNYQTIEIMINDTSGTTDDLVRMKATIPDRRWWTSVSVRSQNAAANINVTLANPDGRLLFPASASGGAQTSATCQLELPKDGTWMLTYFTGEKESINKGDATIEVHQGGASGPVLATKTATVFYFDPTDITIGQGSNYTFANETYNATPSEAVNLRASATIKPAGVNCGASQIKNILIGFAQNSTSYYSEAIWVYDSITWDHDQGGSLLPGAPFPAGTQTTIAKSATAAVTVGGLVCDSSAGNLPVYDQPYGKPVGNPLSLTKPKGCQNGQDAESSDNPDVDLAGYIPFFVPAYRADGTQVGTALYTPARVQITASFEVWAVTYDKSESDPLKAVIPLRQSSWSLNVDSSKVNQHATVPQKDRDPTFAPLTDVPLLNDEIKKPQNQTLTYSTGTVTETK